MWQSLSNMGATPLLKVETMPNHSQSFHIYCNKLDCPLLAKTILMSILNSLQMQGNSYLAISIFLLLVSGTNAVIPGQAGQYLSLANQFLAPQNAARAALRMRPLVWDARLERYAQWYANQRRYDCRLRHSNGPFGENIFWGSGVGWTPAQAVAAWVSERNWYDYWSNSCVGDEDCGHYTQIVWRGTKRVGCASVTCYGGRGVFMTCNYDPPGNYIGERPY